MKVKIKWLSVDNPPDITTPVLVMASKKSYLFGHPQMLAGWYVKENEFGPVNDFKLTDVSGWKVLKWAYAPEAAVGGKV